MNTEFPEDEYGLEQVFEPKKQPQRYYATPSEMNNPGFRRTDLSRTKTLKDGRIIMYLGEDHKMEAWRVK